MTDTVIRAESLGKRYTLGRASSGKYRTFRESLTEAVQAPWRRWRGATDSTQSTGESEFWALRDISFEIKRGEVVGIIGRNGAGKSTLLKVLSRITEPTTGRIALKGRVASLLEVGTGFHQELTGRENIYLNGAILGMSRVEIKAKFDEIVAFAEVEKFLDTPVKRYSSGMYVRLAFAVAAHLEPEILIVDEVLAVGDSDFQKKCLGKMQDVAQGEGRTVLFVSHNMAAIASLTRRSIFLRSGQLAYFGKTDAALTQYFQDMRSHGAAYENMANISRPHIRFMTLRTSEENNIQGSGKSMQIEVHLASEEALIGASFSLQLINQFQQPVWHLWTYDSERPMCRKPGGAVLTFTIPKVRLNVGEYSFRTHFSEPPGGQMFETLDGVCPFEVVRLERTVEWGWRPDACAYFEEGEWQIR